MKNPYYHMSHTLASQPMWKEEGRLREALSGYGTMRRRWKDECIPGRSTEEKEERGEKMSEVDNSQGNTPMLRRVRCGHCQLPLVQLYQGDLLHTLQRNGEETTSQAVPAYSYRVLTDPTPLFFCPRCHATLSPATVTMVFPRTVVPEEGKAEPRPGDL